MSTGSEIFGRMGLGNIDIGYIFIGMLFLIFILLITCIIHIVQMKKLKKRLDKFMLGKDAGNLEKDIIGLYEDNKFLKTSLEKNKKDIRNLYKKSEGSFQKMGLIKYDAFRLGGQLSFSLALLNENNDGFIMNSVHSTEGCYSYTKEVKNGQCAVLLGEEEKKALEIAMRKN